jgi:hypothetical protein
MRVHGSKRSRLDLIIGWGAIEDGSAAGGLRLLLIGSLRVRDRLHHAVAIGVADRGHHQHRAADEEQDRDAIQPADAQPTTWRCRQQGRRAIRPVR